MAQYTLTNLIPTDVGSGSWGTGTLSTTHTLYSSKSLQLTGTTSTPEIVSTYATATIPQIQNHIYYGRIYEYHEATNLDGKGWQIYWPIAEPYFNSTGFGAAGQWNMLSAINVRNSWASGNQSLRVDFDNAYVAGTVWYDGLMLIDLTETFGAGNEPNKTWCDSHIPYFIGTKVISVSLPTVYDLSISTPTSLKNGDIVNCPYTGDYKTLTLKKGTYKLECWGAQGWHYSSSYNGGKGGYSVGTISFTKDTTLYLYTGGYPTSQYVGGFNGGGTGASSGYGGGGGSDIRIGSTSLYARVIVAGGGGGSSSYSTSYGNGGAGGGESGTKSNGADSFGSWGGYPGTQTGPYKSSVQSGSFGTGGIGANGGGLGGAGGGGGWYGGDGGYYAIAAGGGSGYIYTSASASNYPSGCELNSSYYLTAAQTIVGTSSFTGPSGSTETGHTGDGYIRITAIDVGYMITYNANGGAGAPEKQEKDSGVNITLSSVKPEKTDTFSATFYIYLTGCENEQTLSVTNTDSYQFIKWTTNKDGTGESYLPGSIYTTDADLTLYAQYQKITDYGKATLPTGQKSSTTVSIPINLINDLRLHKTLHSQKTYTYNFKNWSTELNGGGITYNAGTAFDKVLTNLKLHANFTLSSSFSSVTLPKLTITGRTFLGWKKAKENTIITSTTYTPTSHQSLHAVWQETANTNLQYKNMIYTSSKFLKTKNYIYTNGKWEALKETIL